MVSRKAGGEGPGAGLATGRGAVLRDGTKLAIMNKKAPGGAILLLDQLFYYFDEFAWYDVGFN